MGSPTRGCKNGTRHQFLRVLTSQIEACRIPLDQRVLIVGGSSEDEQVLRRAGFRDVVNSNLPSDVKRITVGGPPPDTHPLAIDAEEMRLPDDSFDLVFAHAVLHHCSSPHRALCEMLRVSRRYALFLEPNDSLAMSLLVKMRFSFPYETHAVFDNGCNSGGVRDSQIPNFIFRWNRAEVFKTVSSYVPERFFSVRAFSYWDFSLTEKDLDARKETRIGNITSVVGTRNFLSLLRLAQFLLNGVPTLRRQGNKFFCCVEKRPELRPWLLREGERVVFNREFRRCR